jgi:hypothetical protein
MPKLTVMTANEAKDYVWKMQEQHCQKEMRLIKELLNRFVQVK